MTLGKRHWKSEVLANSLEMLSWLGKKEYAKEAQAVHDEATATNGAAEEAAASSPTAKLRPYRRLGMPLDDARNRGALPSRRAEGDLTYPPALLTPPFPAPPPSPTIENRRNVLPPSITVRPGQWDDDVGKR